jgi:pyruvate/2-oxoacid:ferredoxin oxidoreductase alpha subunit
METITRSYLRPIRCRKWPSSRALAFDLADEYRNPVIVLADGYIGQMMEPVAFQPATIERPQPDWAVAGTADTRRNLITSIYLEPDGLEAHVRKLEAKYQIAEEHEVRAESWRIEDAEIVLVGYGIVARVLKAVVEQARACGLAVGLLRPITLYPFPSVELQRLRRCARAFLVVELSNGQLWEDVRLAVEGRRPVELYTRVGGNVPSAEEILAVSLGQGCGARRARGAGACLVTPSRTKSRRAFTNCTVAKPSCSIRRTIAQGAATESYTSWWSVRSMSWAFRTGPF